MLRPNLVGPERPVELRGADRVLRPASDTSRPAAGARLAAAGGAVGPRCKCGMIRGPRRSGDAALAQRKAFTFVAAASTTLPPRPATAGSFLAMGPGDHAGQPADDPAGKYDAKWTREFRFEPAGRNMSGRCAARRRCAFRKWARSRPTRSCLGRAAKPAGPNRAGARPPGVCPRGEGWQFERVVAAGLERQNGRQPGSGGDRLAATAGHDRPARSHLSSDRVPIAAAAGDAPIGGPPIRAAPSRAERHRRQARRPPLRRARTQHPNQARARWRPIAPFPTPTIDRQAHLEEIVTERAGDKPLVVDGRSPARQRPPTPRTRGSPVDRAIQDSLRPPA